MLSWWSGTWSCPSTCICSSASLKQGFARRLLARLRRAADSRQSSLWNTAVEEGRVWQRRFYDFVVFTAKKRVEKVRYMHNNPVKRGLVLEPEQWRWSSYRDYMLEERGPVLVNEPQKIELPIRKVS